MQIESFGLSDPGGVRNENQDRILVSPELCLFLVCDGMGGHSNGGLAAETAVEAIHQYVERSHGRLDITWPYGFDVNLSIEANRLATGIKLANSQIWKKAEQAIEYAGMGSTVTALLVGESRATAANVGDSRIYHLREGNLEQLSVDDTIVASLVAQGTIPASAAANHPMRHVLLQAAGSSGSLNVHVKEQPLSPGDVFLISSDGLHGVVPRDEIVAILSDAEISLEDAATRLIEMAREAGGPDNISAVLVRVLG